MGADETWRVGDARAVDELEDEPPGGAGVHAAVPGDCGAVTGDLLARTEDLDAPEVGGRLDDVVHVVDDEAEVVPARIAGAREHGGAVLAPPLEQFHVQVRRQPEHA
ncbi:hypothetical protein [Streptomyces tendae]|uniref:hypothetical protein n=1 Tax=Streptomyces tendae TaxID=1932 RepID=UPI003818F76F